MIAVPAAPLPPDEAARRAAAQPGAFWLSAPAADEVGVARDLVGTSPVLVAEGTLSDALPAFFGLVVVSLVVAVIANLVQGALRKAFQQSLFRSHIFDTAR